MTQFDLFVHRPLPPNPYEVMSQKWRIYQRIREQGAITNVEVVEGLGEHIYNHRGRLSEIREFLISHGFSLDCSRERGQVYRYEVMDIG